MLDKSTIIYLPQKQSTTMSSLHIKVDLHTNSFISSFSLQIVDQMSTGNLKTKLNSFTYPFILQSPSAQQLCCKRSLEQ